MLASLLLAAVIVGPLATIGLFLPIPSRLGDGALMWTRRLVFALIGTAVLAAVGGYLVYVLNDSRRYALVSAALIVAASVLWLPATRRWNARAHLCWAMNFYLFVVYLVFMLDWTFATPLGISGQVGALLLWLLELFAAVLGTAYLWELCDALGREHWTRRSRSGVRAEDAADVRHPFVSLHVPSYEEPPEMVIETLRALRRLEYDHYEIIAIDDNTVDESLWRPVEAWCDENGVKFVHLEDWPGYKSGALNYALNQLTDPAAEVIGVIDSDYQIDPDFLSRCAPLFNDPVVGFIQSPQDYRDWDGASYFRRLYYSYKYFFAVSQPSRNERDGAIFAGTMGLIRRSALTDVGGWDEWCITEDAELSMRLLRAGWSGLHVDESFGHGVMPLSFEALKGQRFRWCFGGIQILRMHWRSMLPGSRRSNRMTLGQRWAYLSGAVQWYGDLVGVIFFFFLLGGAVNIALGGGLLFRKLSAFLLAAIPLLVLLGFIRAVALIRRGTGASWSDALGAFMIWQSTSLVVARASVQALFAKRAEFLRTPKTSEESGIWTAISSNLAETTLALLGVAGIVAALFHGDTFGGALTAGLLVLPTFAFASAPLNSLAARRATLSPELAARRRTELRRGYYVRRGLSAVAGLGTIAVGAVIVLALLSPGGSDVHAPQLVGPRHAETVQTSPSGQTQTPTTSATTTQTSTTTTQTSTTSSTTATTTAPTTAVTTTASTTTTTAPTTATTTTTTTTAPTTATTATTTTAPTTATSTAPSVAATTAPTSSP
jgi:cellulose synthase/poly-beta-1,6-N-acetylglucosamine synthase-like glycosyltransferase